jgi:hypothetical protein
MYAADPGDRRRVKSDAACPSCGAGAASCRSVRWLRGRTCCEPCQARDGDHDQPTERNDA